MSIGIDRGHASTPDMVQAPLSTSGRPRQSDRRLIRAEFLLAKVEETPENWVTKRARFPATSAHLVQSAETLVCSSWGMRSHVVPDDFGKW